MSIHIAVCGAGAFGRNHIRIYRELPGVHLAAIVDLDPANLALALTPSAPPAPAAQPAPSTSPAPVNPNPGVTPQSGVTPKPGVILSEAAPAAQSVALAPKDLLSPSPASPPPPRTFPTTEALLAAIAAGELHIDAASVCVPTSAHHAVASQLLQAGIHVLVEKPIAATLEQADALIALADQKGKILTVGHLERFNPAVQALAPLLRGPMFFEAHRLSVFSPRSLDTDVVLDLMIHDLDIVLTLAQSPVTQVHAVGLPILSGKTDIANVRVEFASGCVANFTASRVSTERVRKLRFFQPHQYLSIDYARQDLFVIEVHPPSVPTSVTNPQAAASASLSAQSAAPAPPQVAPRLALETWEQQNPEPPALPTLGMHKPQVTPGEPLRLEIESFLQSIRNSTTPAVTAPQARDALGLALQIQQAIETHTQHAGLQAFIAPSENASR